MIPYVIVNAEHILYLIEKIKARYLIWGWLTGIITCWAFLMLFLDVGNRL